MTVRAEGETSDEDVAREVGKTLRSSINVPETVKATARGLQVTLTGAVQRQHKGFAAGRAAGNVKNVTAVVNRLAQNPTSVAGDLEMPSGPHRSVTRSSKASKFTLARIPKGLWRSRATSGPGRRSARSSKPAGPVQVSLR